MKRFFFFKAILISVLICGITPVLYGQEKPQDNLDSRLAQIDLLFEKGHQENYQKSGMDMIKQSLDLCLALMETQPANYEVLWRSSRSAGGYAEAAHGILAQGWKEICREWGKKGMEFAGKAQEIDPKRVEAYFWQTQSIGKYADSTGILTAIKEGFLGKIKNNLKMSYEIDKSYLDYSPVFSNAMFLYNLPPMFGRDNKGALKYLEEYNQNTRWEFEPYIRRPFAAEIYMRFDDEVSTKKAKQMLEAAVALPAPRPYYLNLTKELLEKLK